MSLPLISLHKKLNYQEEGLVYKSENDQDQEKRADTKQNQISTIKSNSGIQNSDNFLNQNFKYDEKIEHSELSEDDLEDSDDELIAYDPFCLCKNSRFEEFDLINLPYDESDKENIKPLYKTNDTYDCPAFLHDAICQINRPAKYIEDNALCEISNLSQPNTSITSLKKL